MGDVSRFSTAPEGQVTQPDASAEDLRNRLADAEETIRAIRHGEVDAVVVNGLLGPQVYTLEGADHPYRVLVEQMHEGTVTLDRNQLILYANPQFAGMMEMASDSVVGSDFRSFLPPVDSNIFRSLVEAANLSRHSSGELNLRAAGGGTVPVRVSMTPLEVAGMQALCIVASDLREQRRNEAIVKEEQLSRLILEQAAEAIVVIDLLGTVVRRSESARRLSGQPTLSNQFDQAFRLSASEAPLDAQRILALARTGEYIRGLEATMFHPDGRRSSLLVSASPLWGESLQGPASDLLGCVITLTDITERKRVEDALTCQADELARSNSDLRQFAYSASHDLREPLRQMAVFSELLQRKYKDSMDDEAGRLVQYTVDSARRMEELLKDLQAYTQAADATQGVAGPSDANEVVRKALAIFETQIAENGAQVNLQPLPVLDVHEVYLRQLFQNLIGNALKYRGEDPPMIRISAQPMSAQPSERMWELSVADNGIGIDPDYQRQIFGLFQRLHGGTKYSGSGIGLAICQKIVQRYGGRIWVESEPGRGSRFMFTLPGRNCGTQ